MKKYELSKVQADLLERGIVDLNGDIDAEMASYFRTCLTILKSKGSPDIIVEITSSGGFVGRGLDIFDMLRLYEGKKSGKVVGFAESMAAVVLQACDKRSCAKHAHILVHYIKKDIGLDWLKDRKKLKKEIDDVQKDQNRIYEIFRNRTGKSISAIKKICRAAESMTAEEAKKFGLIDKII